MSSLISQFGINWMLLIAQMVNFAILFWILKKFAYTPILKILNDRRERIANSLAQAKVAEEKSREGEMKVAEQINEAKAEAQNIIQQAKLTAEGMQKQILDQANKNAESIIAVAKEQLEKERAVLQADMQNMVVETSVAIVKKVLGDKMDEKIRAHLSTEAIEQLPSHS